MDDIRHGLAGTGAEAVGLLVLPAWDAFIDAARSADLEHGTRLPGWRVQEVCTHLGLWPDASATAGLIASARSGATGPLPDADTVNAGVVAAHRTASPAEVIGALEAHRDFVAGYLAGPDRSLDLAPTMSVAGPLPLLSVILGQAYELAVHGLDLAEAGAPRPPAASLDAGIAALAEVTGGLASRMGIDGGATLHTPDGGWTFTAAGAAGWTLTRSTGSRPSGAVVESDAATLLDASAGRNNPVLMVARRKLRIHDVPALMKLAPIVESAPGIPGGPLLSVAAKSLSGAGGVLGRFRRG